MSLQDYSKQATFSDAAGDYLERHRVYELFQSMLRSLAIHKPKAPIPFLISTLTQRQDQKRIILGAPQNAELSSRNVQAAKIVKEFGVVHLRVSELVQEEVVKKTPLGIKARGFIEKGLEVPDAVSVAVIMNRISKQDCTTQGWLLDGFPNTQAQAQALQAAGCLANKFIYLNVPTDTLKFRLLDAAQREEKAAGGEEKSSTSSSMSLATPLSSLPRAAATFNAALPLVQRIETQATAIECRLASVAQQFTHCCAVINDVADTNVVYTNIANFIKAVEASDAPRRPQRVLVLGPLGAGKSTVALKLAEKYDLVHLSVGSLLRSESEKPSSSSAKRTDAASSYAAMGEPIPDHIVGPMILERLQQDDCKSRGWILEGFPRTLHQASILAKAGVLPSRCIFLEAADKACIDRVIHKRFDPVTEEFIDIRQRPPVPGSAVAKRLQHLNQHKEHTVRAVINNYRTGVDQLKSVYANISIEVDATKTPREVYEVCDGFVAAPLPVTTQSQSRANEDNSSNNNRSKRGSTTTSGM